MGLSRSNRRQGRSKKQVVLDPFIGGHVVSNAEVLVARPIRGTTSSPN